MRKRTIFQILVLLALVIILGLFWYFDFGSYLTLENLQMQSTHLKEFVDMHFIFSALIFVAIYIIIITFSLPGAAILSLAGGFLFGMVFGTLLNAVGATIGALIAFLMTRFLLGEPLQQKFSKQLEIFNQELSQYGIYYLLAIRLIPIFPFFLINILCGLTKISIQTFFITTALGIIPGDLIYTYAGTQLASITSLREIFSTKIIIAFLFLASFIVLPLIIKRLWESKKR